MALSDEERNTIRHSFCKGLSRRFEPIGSISKADLKNAVTAIDDWIDDNLVSFNNAIPQPARAELTAKQKAELFFFVAKRRWEVS